MLQAVMNPLIDNLHQQCMQPQRGSNQVMYVWIRGGSPGGEIRDILVPVSSRGQEVGEYNHQASPLSDTLSERGRYGRLRQFHVCWFDNLPLGELAKGFDDLQ